MNKKIAEVYQDGDNYTLWRIEGDGYTIFENGNGTHHITAPNEETTPSGKRYVCKIYPTEGKEFEAVSVKPERNACGYGYRIIDRQGRVMFYKTNEVAGIMPIREEIK